MAIIIFLIGLFLGSTVYAFAWRYHEHKNWLTGRSECDHCHHTLSTLDLIPVISWMLLRGKCRYCHKSFTWQYPLVEVVTAGLFYLSYIFWSYSFHGIGLFEFILWLIILTGFMILTVYDLRWFELPDKVVFSLTTLAFLNSIVVTIADRDPKHLVGGVIGAVIISGIFYILFHISNGKWIGGGDVKLGVCLGLIVGGPIDSILLIFIASLLGTLIATPISVRRKTMHTHIPFGPLLMLATGIVFFFGNDIVSWYNRLIT